MSNLIFLFVPVFFLTISPSINTQTIEDRAIGSDDNQCPKYMGENACSEVKLCCYNRIKLNGKEHRFCLNKKD